MKINLKPVGNILKGLFREGLQTLPVVGTIVTNLKTDTKQNPKGQVKLSRWDVYRLLLGFGVGYVLIKGLLTLEQVTSILEMIGF